MKNNKKIKIFLIIVLVFEILYWVIQIIMQGKWLNTYFVNDFNDTGMDYFNMLSNIFYVDPYTFDSNYPALCFLLWKVLFHIMPVNDNCGDGFYLRNYMPAQVGYIIFTVVCILIIWEMVKYICRDINVNSILISTIVILSGPVLFTLERGNIIILSFAMLLVFLSFYDSDEKWKRYIGYVALAISVAIKIYPVLFGLLILYKKRYKEAIATTCIGIGLFFVPFYLFAGGDSIKAMIRGIMTSSSDNASIGNNYNFSMANFLDIMSKLANVEIPISNIAVIILVVSLCFVLFILSNEVWKKLLAIVLMCIWIPAFSYTYILLFLICPFLYFIKEQNITRMKKIYALFFLIILSPIALPGIKMFSMDGVKFPLGYPTLIINFAIILLFAFAFLESVRTYIKYRKGGKLNA